VLHDHIECGKHSAADVVAEAQAVLSESELLWAMSVIYRPIRRHRIDGVRPVSEPIGRFLKLDLLSARMCR